jgi:hypothetical protein
MHVVERIVRLVRLRRAIVPRNIREPSKKVLSPCVGDVDGPHRETCTRKAEQHHHVLRTHRRTHRHLADSQVERVRLWLPPVQKRYDHRGVILESCHALRRTNLSS